MPILYLNNAKVIKFTNKLEQISKTTLPNVVRATLNAAALDVKQNTMPKTALHFERREINFFKGTSKVEFVKNTHNINEMQSSVGFSEEQLKKLKKDNFAVKDLEEQEYGGMIGGRSFIPLPAAREGNYNMGLVIPKFRLNEIKKKYFVDAKKFPGRNNRERFIRAAVFVGKGGFVIGTGLDQTFLFQIDDLVRFKSGKTVITRSQSSSLKKGGMIVKATKLYTVKPHRSVSIKETEFMQKASEMTAKKLEGIYINLAKARFERDLKV